MDNEEFELVDDQPQDSNESIDFDSTETEIEEDEDNTSSQKPKNESNFKKLYKAHKEDQKRIAELEQAVQYLAQQQPTSDQSNYQDEDKLEKNERKLFLIENKEASEHLDKVIEARNKYGMEYEDAWTFVKAKLPKPSQSTSDFDFKSEPVKVKKTLADITPEEALKLPKDQLARWQVYHGYASE